MDNKKSYVEVKLIIKGITKQGILSKGNVFEQAEKECKKYNKRRVANE